MNYYQQGFVHIPSENDARNYPVAPGNSVTFINDNAPYCYTKTMGFSQFDAPVFRKFKIIEETASEPQKCPSESVSNEQPSNALKELKSEIEALQTRIEAIERRTKNEPVKSVKSDA